MPMGIGGDSDTGARISVSCSSGKSPSTGWQLAKFCVLMKYQWYLRNWKLFAANCKRCTKLGLAVKLLLM